MGKYILLYKGPATPMDSMAKEQVEKINELWKQWIERLGDALVDVGAPMANGQSVVDDGSTATATLFNGYSIIQANNIDEAKGLVEDHPFLSDKSGKFSIELFELLPLPM